MELFVVASRKKFRFETVRGLVSVEDLWDMPLTGGRDNFNLDAVAILLDKQAEAKSFVKRKSPSDSVQAQKLEIVKFVIADKLAEAEAADQAKARAERRGKLLEALQSKESTKLAGMSEEEIKAELAKL